MDHVKEFKKAKARIDLAYMQIKNMELGDRLTNKELFRDVFKLAFEAKYLTDVIWGYDHPMDLKLKDYPW